MDTEDGVCYIVVHVVPNTDDPTCKSDLPLGFSQGKLLLVWEAFCSVLQDDGSNSEVIRPLVLDIFCSCYGENIATTDLIRLGILIISHTWGDEPGCSSCM